VNAGAVVLNTTLTGFVTVKNGASFAGTVPSNGVTTYSLKWQRPGLLIRVR